MIKTTDGVHWVEIPKDETLANRWNEVTNVKDEQVPKRTIISYPLTGLDLYGIGTRTKDAIIDLMSEKYASTLSKIDPEDISETEFNHVIEIKNDIESFLSATQTKRNTFYSLMYALMSIIFLCRAFVIINDSSYIAGSAVRVLTFLLFFAFLIGACSVGNSTKYIDLKDEIAEYASASRYRLEYMKQCSLKKDLEIEARLMKRKLEKQKYDDEKRKQEAILQKDREDKQKAKEKLISLNIIELIKDIGKRYDRITFSELNEMYKNKYGDEIIDNKKYVLSYINELILTGSIYGQYMQSTDSLLFDRFKFMEESSRLLDHAQQNEITKKGKKA